MKKILLCCLITTSFLISDMIKIIPTDKSFLSTENGGTLSAIDAYSDGVGFITDSVLTVDNSPLNNLVFKYGEEAKKANKSLIDYVLQTSTNPEELNMVNEILSNNPNGTPCNDNNSKTINDAYFNGICVGTNVEGQVCNDNNVKTINDIYVSGICIGENVEGQVCNDNNSATMNDTYHNGVCSGIQNRTENKCLGEPIGSTILVNGVNYLVVDNTTIRTNLNRASTLCTSNVTDMNNLFYFNVNFNDNINSWDVSNVTNMNNMFNLASSFNQPLNTWNVSKVTNMRAMFYKAYNFNQNISMWNVSNVTVWDFFYDNSGLYFPNAPIKFR